MKTVNIKRSEAAQIIEDIREALARTRMGDEGSTLEAIEGILRNEYGPQQPSRAAIPPLTPCPGDAHRPEIGGNIDNCSLCAPRWGLVGPKVVVR